MENLKINISNNLVNLRKNKKLTQKQLAEKLNYSDKAISRWETGESLPDIDILIKLCDYYGIEFEWLLHKHDDMPKITKSVRENVKIAIALLFIVGCFTLATVVFVYTQMLKNIILWQVFVWALQVSTTICVICSFKWWNKISTTILLSIDLWVTLTCVFLYFLNLKNAWLVYLIGVPIQIIIILLHIIRKEKNKD